MTRNNKINKFIKWLVLIIVFALIFGTWYDKVYLNNKFIGPTIALALGLITFIVSYFKISIIGREKPKKIIDTATLNEINELCEGDLDLMVHFINDHFNTGTVATLFENLNEHLDNKFSSLTYDDWKSLYPLLDLDKSKHQIIISGRIDKTLLEKLKKNLKLEQNGGYYFIAYKPILDGLMDKFINAKSSVESDNSIPGSFLEEIGKFYYKSGNWKRAEENLLKYLETGRKNNNVRSICNANLQLALVYQHMGEYNKERQCCDDVLNYVNECEPVTVIDTFILLGDNRRMKGEYSNAMEHFERAENLIKKYPVNMYTLQEARISLSKSFIYNHWENSDAEKELKNAFELFKKINDLEGQGSTKVYWGIYYLDSGDFSSAGQMFIDALNISRFIKNRNLENFALNYLTKLRFFQNKKEEAFELSIEAINIQIEKGTIFGIAISFMILSPIIDSLPLSFDKSRLIPELNFISTFYSDLLPKSERKLLQELNKIDDSIDLPLVLCNCAINIFKQLDAKYALCEAFLEKARIHIKRRDFKTTRKIFSEIRIKYSSVYDYKKVNSQIYLLTDTM